MSPKKVLFTATVVKTHINAFHLPFLKMFKDAGWEVHVAAKNDFTDEPCVIPYCDKYYDVNFDRFPFSKKNLYAYKQLKKIIIENQYNIIHCNTPVAGVLTRLAARFCKTSMVIYTAHGFHFFKGAPLINWILYYPIEWFCARLTDKLITINKEDFQNAQNWSLRNDGDLYLVNGVGFDEERLENCNISISEKRASLNIPKGYKVLVSVGELNSNKNHEVVIRALSTCKRKDYMYLICGRGLLEAKLRNLILELGLQDNVKLLGYRSDIIEILKVTDLFIFPSKREGLPLSLMEALAEGCVCLASDVRGNRDLINGKYLCKSNSVDEWKRILEAFFDKKGIHSCKLNNKYYMKNILKEMGKIYFNRSF